MAGRPKLEAGRWKLEGGSSKMENGSWKMENGSSKMEDGSFLFPTSYFLLLTSYFLHPTSLAILIIACVESMNITEDESFREISNFRFGIFEDVHRASPITLHPFARRSPPGRRRVTINH